MIVDNHKKIIPKALKKKECSCINPIVKEKSFNEDIELDYDKIGHNYLYQGNTLQGVTDYISKFYGEFNIDTVAKSCGKLWGVDPQEVADLWESNGKISSQFGTAIHDALEHWERFKDLGLQISQIRQQGLNYALPKHPTLEQIVMDFISINKVEGNVLTEVLVTDVANKLAGRADRIVIIDMDRKICRIGDYKINVEADKKESKLKAKGFEYLPNTKITKYQIQLSVYANMLQKSGWRVDGLDVYIYEGEWTYHPLDVLKII